MLQILEKEPAPLGSVEAHVLSYSVRFLSIDSLTASVTTATDGATVMSVLRFHLAAAVDALRGGVAFISIAHNYLDTTKVTS